LRAEGKAIFRVLKLFSSDEQIYDIHQAVLEILWHTGVLVKAPDARSLLRQAGAIVDDETMLCRIPSYVVEEALKRAPSSFTVYARNPENDVHVSTKALHYEPMIGRLNCHDYQTGTTHRTTLEDVGHLVKIADAMPRGAGGFPGGSEAADAQGFQRALARLLSPARLGRARRAHSGAAEDARVVGPTLARRNGMSQDAGDSAFDGAISQVRGWDGESKSAPLVGRGGHGTPGLERTWHAPQPGVRGRGRRTAVERERVQHPAAQPS
jgi:hypothetical protein